MGAEPNQGFDGSAKDDGIDARPQDRSEAHHAWFRGAVENQRTRIACLALMKRALMKRALMKRALMKRALMQLVHRIDLAMPNRVDVRTIPSSANQFTRIGIDNYRTERSTRHVSRRVDCKVHQVRMIQGDLYRFCLRNRFSWGTSNRRPEDGLGKTSTFGQRATCNRSVISEPGRIENAAIGRISSPANCQVHCSAPPRRGSK